MLLPRFVGYGRFNSPALGVWPTHREKECNRGAVGTERMKVKVRESSRGRIKEEVKIPKHLAHRDQARCAFAESPGGSPHPLGPEAA